MNWTKIKVVLTRAIKSGFALLIAGLAAKYGDNQYYLLLAPVLLGSDRYLRYVREVGVAEAFDAGFTRAVKFVLAMIIAGLAQKYGNNEIYLALAPVLMGLDKYLRWKN